MKNIKKNKTSAAHKGFERVSSNSRKKISEFRSGVAKEFRIGVVKSSGAEL